MPSAFRSLCFCLMTSSFLSRSSSSVKIKDQKKWTFLGSVFFVNNLVTTIGYGSLHPQTEAGQLFWYAQKQVKKGSLGTKSKNGL